MPSTERHDRNFEQEGLERDRYIVLLHLYTLGQASHAPTFPLGRIMKDLGFPSSRTDQIVHDLIEGQYLEDSGTAEGVMLTAKARLYLEHTAGRRRSVRLLH